MVIRKNFTNIYAVRAYSIDTAFVKQQTLIKKALKYVRQFYVLNIIIMSYICTFIDVSVVNSVSHKGCAFSTCNVHAETKVNFIQQIIDDGFFF